MKTIILYCIFLFLNSSIPKSYVHTYYNSGKKMSCGWVKANKKTDYWYFYYENGNKKSHGHFNNNLKQGFWFFFNNDETLLKKGHYEMGKPTGWWIYQKKNIKEKCLFQKDGITRFCLVYKENQIIKASKYINDTFVQEWNSVGQFKRDNPNFSF